MIRCVGLAVCFKLCQLIIASLKHIFYSLISDFAVPQSLVHIQSLSIWTNCNDGQLTGQYLDLMKEKCNFWITISKEKLVRWIKRMSASPRKNRSSTKSQQSYNTYSDNDSYSDYSDSFVSDTESTSDKKDTKKSTSTVSGKFLTLITAACG